MIRALVRRLAALPSVFDLLRWMLEGGYRGHTKLLRERLPSGAGRVLDCGCGTGIYAAHFDPAEYVGVDISATYVSAARHKFHGHSFQVADATQLPFESGVFERAFASGVLHHLDDDTAIQVLSELDRVLTANGLLVVWEDIPAKRWWNLVGKLIHRLDMGEFIRRSDEYRDLLKLRFDIQEASWMRSGFMDYAVYCCVKQADVEQHK